MPGAAIGGFGTAGRPAWGLPPAGFTPLLFSTFFELGEFPFSGIMGVGLLANSFLARRDAGTRAPKPALNENTNARRVREGSRSSRASG
jgi:hypothetical protein